MPFAKALEVRDRCLCFGVQRAARALARQFDEVFRPLGLSNGQFSLLVSLNRPDPPVMGEVAGLLGMDRTTLTAALKPLERRGLVKVGVDPQDKRSRRLVLTRAGRALLSAAYPLWNATLAELEAALGNAERLRADLAQLGREAAAAAATLER